MVKSDALLLFIGNCIAADPDKWGIMLTTKHGKKGVQTKFIDFLTKHANPLTNGKSTSTETLSKWIKAGLEVGADEAKRRTDGENSGRGAANGSMPELCSVWCDLDNIRKKIETDKPSTDRYNTAPEHLLAPEHLRGKVQLIMDDSPMLPCGREERAAGSEMREDAISFVAEQRERVRKENPESKEHLRGKKMREEPATSSSIDPTDAMIQSYIAMETARCQADIRAQKIVEMNSYVEALKNPNINAATRATMEMLLAAVTKDLHQQPAAADISGPIPG